MQQYTACKTVENELSALETELAGIITSQVDLVTNVGKRLLISEGKRLRPTLFFLIARNGQMSQLKTMPVAVAIELIHIAALVHDDVIESAAIRRGVQTTKACLGNHISVLAGDFFFAKAFSLVSAAANASALKILTEAVCAICEGEILQIRNQFNPHQTEVDYLECTAKKTASFIAASCELGANVAESDETSVEALKKYGYAVGMAFQIVEDLLDIIATMEQSGKPPGNDLRQGILTLPVLYALQKSPRRDELKKMILARDMSDVKLRKILTIIQQAGGIAYTRQRVYEYLQIARQSIPSSLENDVREDLKRIVDLVVWDNHRLDGDSCKAVAVNGNCIPAFMG